MTEKNKTNLDSRSVAASMSSDSLEPVELLADDFMHRQRSGEKPTIDEYCEKHPELADEIREVFPALAVIEQVAPATADLDASNRSFTSPDAKPIERIGDYRVLREIGRGGMGVVYEAEQESLGRRVALKVLPRHIAKDEKSLLRFQREARAAARMHHTNIVPVFEVGHDNDYSFYAMQLIKGQGLDHVIDDLRDLRSEYFEGNKRVSQSDQANRERIAVRSIANSLMAGDFNPEPLEDSAPSLREPLPQVTDAPALGETTVQATGATGSTVSAALPGEGDVSTAEGNRRAYFQSVAEIGLQAANALAYAHARGITHRDIKPSNLILDTAGVVWVTDFGLARTGDSSMTQTGDILGTIRYMSPERFKGQCDNRADVYSLGLTLYEMLVLKPAFESPDRLKLIDIVTCTEVAAPRSIDSRIPRDLETIVLKACDKDPKRRYQSADEMAEDIQRFVNDEPILARRASPAERVARWSRRNPWLATAMTVAAAALIVITGISMVAAQAQATLNEQLEDANHSLNAKSEEQRKTNAQLAASNRTKEELIGDLRLSQARRAEKQAQFVAAQGDLAESMLCLLQAYELTPKHDGPRRRRLYRKLGEASRKMPRLVAEAMLDSRREDIAEVLINLQRINIGPVGREARAMRSVATSDNSFLRVFAGGPRLASRSSIIAVPTTYRKDGEQESDGYQFWDVENQRWTGQEIHFDAFIRQHAFHSESRSLAVITVEWDNPAVHADESGEKRKLGSTHSSVVLTVYGIDSGTPRFTRRWNLGDLAVAAGFPVQPNNVAIGPLFAASVQFSSDGDRLFVLNMRARGAVSIETLDAENGETTERDSIATLQAAEELPAGGELRAFGARVSRDGKRLFCTSFTRADVINANKNSGHTLCFDVATGDVISRLPFDDGQPFVLDDEGSQVALIRNVAGVRNLQAYDVDSGEAASEPIVLSNDVDFSRIQTDGKHIFVTSSVPSGDLQDLVRSIEPVATQQRCLVEAFRLETGKLVGSPIPASSPRAMAMSADSQTLSVVDENTVRTWRFPQQKMRRVLMPAPMSGFTGLTALQAQFRDGPLAIRNFVDVAKRGSPTRLGTFAVNDDGHLVIVRPEKQIQIEHWDTDSGRLLSTEGIPDSEAAFAVCLSPSGKFLLLARSEWSEEIPEDATKRQYSARLWSVNERSFQDIPIELGEVPLAVGDSGQKVAIYKVLPDADENVTPQEAIRIAESGTFANVRIFDPKDGTSFRLPPIPSRGELIGAAFSKNGDRLDIVGVPVAKTFDLRRRVSAFAIGDMTAEHLANREIRDTYDGGNVNLTMMDTWTVSADGSVWAHLIDPRTIRVLRTATDEVVDTITLPETTVVQLKLSTDGSELYTSSSDGLIRCWCVAEALPSESKELQQVVHSQIGMSINGDDEVQFNRMAGPRDSMWHAKEVPVVPTLLDSEMTAISAWVDQRWEDVAEQFDRWITKRGDEWLPRMLQISALFQNGDYDKATANVRLVISPAGKETTRAWLMNGTFGTYNFRRHPQPARFLRPKPESAAKIRWRQHQMLELAGNDAEASEALFILAKCDEVDKKFDSAVEYTNRAVAMAPDHPEIQYYRAHLMERLGHWDEALESRKAMWRLEPENVDSPYRAITGMLFTGKTGEFHESWAQYYEQRKAEFKREDAFSGHRDRLAKPRLLAGGPRDESFNTALELADANYKKMGFRDQKFADWRRLCKGIAEYRRGEPDNLRTAIKVLDTAYAGFSESSNFKRGAAITRFVAAMAHHKLGHEDIAADTYLDGIDRHERDRADLGYSDRAVANDWQLAEVARREAEQLLKIDLAQIDPQIADTSDWQVVLEDDFDESVGKDWEELDGEWSVVDGAACGSLEHSDTANEAYAQLEREIPGAPSTFEVEYETWTSDRMLAACFLRQPPTKNLLSALGLTPRQKEETPVGLRVALASHPDRLLTDQGKPGSGLNLLTHAPFGVWINKSLPDFKAKPNQHYKVRILRQPQRITLFIDDKQVLSERVRNIETRNLRFFARGEPGTKMFIDNLTIKAPSSK